ncbi:MAG: serine/threonine-protein kinase [Polyangiaceae bacterium]
MTLEALRTSSKDAIRKTLHQLDYLPPGSVVAGKYAVESVIGEGATSVVYVARRLDLAAPARTSPAAREADEESDRPAEPRLVALKIIHRSLCEDPQIVGRFRREAAILRRLEGAHVLRVYEMCEHDGLLVIVLEFVPSKPLDERLLEGPELGVAAAIEIALQVCAGLGTAHACGVVHRDLKPANVLYAEVDDGEGLLVKVADFGLAKLVHGDKMVTGLTEHDMIFGTPEYMAPEQARGEDLDLRADIYALGCMLYEMLTGDVPFRGHSPMVTMTAHLMQEVVPPRKKRADGTISPALEAVVMRALAKNPADRFPSARAFAEALRGADASTRVIAATGNADALSDTDLNLQATGLAHSPTLPGEPLAETHENAAIAISAPMPASPGKRALDDDITLDHGPLPSTSHSGSLWTWVVIGVLAAVGAIAIGILAGSR